MCNMGSTCYGQSLVWEQIAQVDIISDSCLYTISLIPRPPFNSPRAEGGLGMRLVHDVKQDVEYGF